MTFRLPVHGRVLHAPAMPSSQGISAALDAGALQISASSCEKRVLTEMVLLPISAVC